MININFDNPFLLLLLIPMALLVIVPFAIAIRKENKSKETTLALICHLVIVTLVVLAAAGMMNVAVITKTELYAVADVSYSANEKLELIDTYIADLEKQLPQNSKMGVVTFGKEVKLHTPLGGKITSVKDSGTDVTATDIVSALKYTDSLFSEDTIKRIVLYTDGLSTDTGATGELIRLVEDMKARGIYLDVVYIDSNISDEAIDVQVSDVEFNESTYLGHKTAANILVESTVEADVIIRLTKNGSAYLEKTESLTKGYNIVNFDLYTDEAGEFDYKVSLTIRGEEMSLYNNAFSFTQKVNENISILLVTDNKSDVDTVKLLFGENAEIKECIKPKPPKQGSKPEPFDVPFTVEELCEYDQYILSNVSLEEINNADEFVKSLDICVSVFGKSLITAGDNNLQNSDATSVISLNNMLPVKFGNNDQDPKLYTIVIDSSRSMEFQNFDFFKMAKSAAKYLLDFLDEDDYFAIVHFSGEVYVPFLPRQATPENVAEAKTAVDNLTVTQGTMIGRTLDRVCDIMIPYTFDEKQVMLISDGMSFEGGETSLVDDPVAAATRLRENNITVSTLNAGNTDSVGVSTMKSIASAGGGKYYFAESSKDLVGVMFNEIADDVTDTLITGTTDVIINRKNDAVLEGIDSLPAIEGYVYSKPKASAENVLLVDYVKSSGNVVQAPLYSYWEYGNGRVATLTTNLGGEWVKGWQEGAGLDFLHNIKTTNIPDTRIDYPYTVELDFDGKYIHVNIIPVVTNPDATMTVTVVLPDGTELSGKLTFDSYRYFYKFETGVPGKYLINTSYDWATKSYVSSNVFNISYSPEYDSFNVFSPAVLHTFVRNNGTVTEDGNVTLKTDETKLETYIFRFTVPFLAVAAVLYVVDTVIRKLKWADIKSFFKKRSKKEASK